MTLRDGKFIFTLDPNTSWAIIAHSQWPGASGILAASSDIVQVIEAGDFEILTIFPSKDEPVGLYLWSGHFDDTEQEYAGTTDKIAVTCAEEWLKKNGAKP